MSDLSAVQAFGGRGAGNCGSSPPSGRAVFGPASPFTLYCSQSVDWACRDPEVWVAGPGVTGYTSEEVEGQILRPPAEECCGLRAACGLTADRRRLAASLRARTCPALGCGRRRCCISDHSATSIHQAVAADQQQWRSRASRSRSPSTFERLVFGKLYFPESGFFLAFDGDQPVGFAHAGFGPSQDRRWISTETGIVCMLLVCPDCPEPDKLRWTC